jgi:hypothetical protein
LLAKPFCCAPWCREKERQRLAEVQAKTESLESKLAALRLENAQLAHWGQLMEKTLTVSTPVGCQAATSQSCREAICCDKQQALRFKCTCDRCVQFQQQAAYYPARPNACRCAQVRNTMLALMQQLESQGPPLAVAGWGSQPPATAAAQAGAAVEAQEGHAALQAASRSVAAAVGQLPSLQQLEALVAQPSSASAGREEGSGSGGGGSGSGGGGGALDPSDEVSGTLDGVHLTKGGATRIADVLASASVSESDVERISRQLQELGAPPPDNRSLRSKVEVGGVPVAHAGRPGHMAGLSGA